MERACAYQIQARRFGPHKSSTRKKLLELASPEQLVLELDLASLRQLLHGNENEFEAGRENERTYQINVPHELKRRGVEAKLILNAGKEQQAPTKDENLILAIAKAHHWLDQLTNGSAASISEVAEANNEDRNEISRFLPLAFLAPDIVESILNGHQPVDLTLERIRRIGELPEEWQAQRSTLGFQS